MNIIRDHLLIVFVWLTFAFLLTFSLAKKRSKAVTAFLFVALLTLSFAPMRVNAATVPKEAMCVSVFLVPGEKK